MKIHYLHIKNYKQFSGLELDLTYPEGHAKAGQPLDKICLIGQSGTGKTNILNIFCDKPNDESIKTAYAEENNKNGKVYFVGAGRGLDFHITNFSNKMSVTDTTLLDALKKERNRIEEGGIASVGRTDIFHKRLQQLDDNIDELQKKYNLQPEKDNSVTDECIQIDGKAWELLEEKIVNYDKERLKYTDSLSNKLLNIDTYIKEDFIKEREEWEAMNENIVEKISDKLNAILIKFNLELTKIDKNQKSYNDLTVKDLSNDSIIEYDALSTGAKNLLSTFIPLKIYNPKDSIILIDEPEMSFYPDIQKQLTDLYISVGENNQLIIATHSPLIASSFEPWEVVELKFDKHNQVCREKYYEGENHIDNYTIDPRLLTWTSILTDVFDLKEDSNFSEREKSLMEYASLKSEIKLIEDKSSQECQAKIKRFKKLSQLLGLQN